VNADHRRYLEAIATSDDPAVRPGDRIRAIELLHDADDPDADLFEASTSLRDEELDREHDAMTAVMIQLIRRDPKEAARYPLTTAAIGPDALTARHFTALAQELDQQRAGNETATDEGALDGPASKDATPEPRGKDDATRTPEVASGEEPVEQSEHDPPPGWQLERGWSDSPGKRPGLAGYFD
jgi:hypothetical protein